MADYTHDNGKPDATVVRFIDDSVFIETSEAGKNIVLSLKDVKEVAKAYKGYKKAGN